MFKHIKAQGKDRMIDERFPKAAYQKNIPLWTLWIIFCYLLKIQEPSKVQFHMEDHLDH